MELLTSKLRHALDKRDREHRLIKPVSPAIMARMTDFGSNDTLGLSTSGILTRAFLEQIGHSPGFMVGSTSTRIFEGTRQYLSDLEDGLAQFHNAEEALFFNSGFDANVAVFSTIPRPDDIIVHDEYVHASIHEGMKRGRARTISFPHNDCYAFRHCLEHLRYNDHEVADGKRIIFIVIESIYSMDGDTAPVQGLLQIARETLPRGNFVFCIDEAHSNGIVGPNGAGFVSNYGLEKEFGIRLHTCGKALGSNGAVVLCNRAIKDTLINYAKNVIFTTAPSFVTAAAVRAGYKVICSDEGEKRRENLQQNLRHFYEVLLNHPDWEAVERQKVLRVPTTRQWTRRLFHTPIIPLITPPDEENALARYMQQARFLANPVRYPIVPKGLGRVRISMHADNTTQSINEVVRVIMEWGTTRMKRAIR